MTLTPEELTNGGEATTITRRLTKTEKEKQRFSASGGNLEAIKSPLSPKEVSIEANPAIGVLAKKLLEGPNPLILVLTDEIRLEKLKGIEEDYSEQQEESVAELGALLENMRLSSEVGFPVEIEVLKK